MSQRSSLIQREKNGKENLEKNIKHSGSFYGVVMYGFEIPFVVIDAVTAEKKQSDEFWSVESLNICSDLARSFKFIGWHLRVQMDSDTKLASKATQDVFKVKKWSIDQ